MALSATVYHIQIELSDVDRGVYESLDLRVARHPSESMPYLLTRVIAYALLFEEGIAFSKGLSTTDEPALWVQDLQGNLRVWVELGTPSADRLHKASKASPRVVVFTQHDPRLLIREAASRPIHKAEQIEVYALEPAFLDGWGRSRSATRAGRAAQRRPALRHRRRRDPVGHDHAPRAGRGGLVKGDAGGEGRGRRDVALLAKKASFAPART